MLLENYACGHNIYYCTLSLIAFSIWPASNLLTLQENGQKRALETIDRIIMKAWKRYVRDFFYR